MSHIEMEELDWNAPYAGSNHREGAARLGGRLEAVQDEYDRAVERRKRQVALWIDLREASALVGLRYARCKRAAEGGEYMAELVGRVWYVNRRRFYRWAMTQRRGKAGRQIPVWEGEDLATIRTALDRARTRWSPSDR